MQTKNYIYAVLLSVCATLVVQSARAQDEARPDEQDGIEEITVTGSRIKRTDFDGPQPVVVFDRAYLESTGFNDVSDFGRYLPQSHQTMSESVGQYSGVAEASQFNLRGLGADSTLTLVNGLRVAPYGQSLWGDPFSDITAIPMAAIERIEVLKDGASAIYGADAVAGVINIVLRKDFVGTEVSGGYQVTSRGDNAEWNVDLYHGGQLGNFHYMLGLFYQDRDPLYSRDRAMTSDPDFSDVGGYNMRSFFSSPPTIVRYDTFTAHADDGCGAEPLITNIRTYPEYPGESECAFNWNQFDMLYRDRQRTGANAKLGYEFANGLHLFGDLLYSQKDTFSEIAQTPVASYQLDTWFGLPFVPADHPNNTYGTDLEIGYRVRDVGQRQAAASSKQHRVTVGLEGQLGAWSWNASVMDSANRYHKDLLNAILLFDFQDALLGLGGPNGDQYYNPFGLNPQNDPAMIAGFVKNTWEGSRTSERSLDIVANCALGDLRGGAVQLAVGFQVRQQELEEHADEPLANGLIAGRGPDWLLPHADRRIDAVFAELGLPIWDGVEAQVAARYEEYSDFGSTTNPKLAVRWRPMDALALRASWGTSFHAPDFNDLYQNPVEYFDYLVDTPRCEITGLDADCNGAPYRVYDAGNTNVQPELGESWYGGFEWTPTGLEDFDLRVGYWRFEYEDRIVWVGGQFVLENLPVDNPYIERFPQTPEEEALGIPGRISLVHVTTHNLASQYSDGIDVELNWLWRTARSGEWSLRLDYTYTISYEFTLPEVFDYAEYSRAGWYWDGPLPRNRGNVTLSWRGGAHDVTATTRYVGHYRHPWMEFVPVNGEDSDIPFIVDEFVTLDLQYVLHLDMLDGAKLRIGCNNCTGEDPPFTHDTSVENIHDVRGVIWYANWTQAF